LAAKADGLISSGGTLEPCLRRGVDYDHRYGAVVKHRRRNRAE
jgi:hypothetical protein